MCEDRRSPVELTGQFVNDIIPKKKESVATDTELSGSAVTGAAVSAILGAVDRFDPCQGLSIFPYFLAKQRGFLGEGIDAR